MSMNGTKNEIINVLYIIFCLLICIGILFVGKQNWNAGKKSTDYKHICIEGYTYHTINFGNKMAVAIKLDSEGKPVPCQNVGR